MRGGTAGPDVLNQQVPSHLLCGNKPRQQRAGRRLHRIKHRTQAGAPPLQHPVGDVLPNWSACWYIIHNSNINSISCACAYHNNSNALLWCLRPLSRSSCALVSGYAHHLARELQPLTPSTLQPVASALAVPGQSHLNLACSFECNTIWSDRPLPSAKMLKTAAAAAAMQPVLLQLASQCQSREWSKPQLPCPNSCPDAADLPVCSCRRCSTRA